MPAPRAFHWCGRLTVARSTRPQAALAPGHGWLAALPAVRSPPRRPDIAPPQTRNRGEWRVAPPAPGRSTSPPRRLERRHLVASRPLVRRRRARFGPRAEPRRIVLRPG